jgi:hypothetical protein
MPDIGDHLEDVIKTYNTPSTVKLVPDTSIAIIRKLLFYLWLCDYNPALAKSGPRIIRKNDLLRYVGKGSERTADFHFDSGELSTWITHDQDATGEFYKIDAADLQRLESVLNTYYNVLGKIPFLGMPGYVFVRQLFNSPNNPDLFDEVMRAFREAFNEHRMRKPYLITNPVYTHQRSGAGISLMHATDENFYFLMGLFPNQKALPFYDTTVDWDTARIGSRINSTRYEQQKSLGRTREIFRALVISPDVADIKAFSDFVASPYVYHIRPIEVLHFFTEIKRILDEGIATPKELAERVDDMFPEETLWNFNVEFALQILRKQTWAKISPVAGFIVPVLYDSTAPFPGTLEFGFINGGHLMSDPDFDEHSAQRRTITFENNLYSYTTMHIDISQSNAVRPAGYQFANLTDIKNETHPLLKLTECERRVAHAACASVSVGGD